MVLQEEDSPLKALDVVVSSPALTKNNQRYFVGLLAVENEDNIELEETDNKALSDQSLVVAITSLAIAGIMGGSYGGVQTITGVNEVEYTIGTGLPVRLFPRFHRKFEERLVGEHEVTFLTTPGLRDRKVRVIVRRAVVSIEGAAAILNLATHDNLQVKDEELYYGTIGVCEVGALTTDLPVIKRMAVDNQFSHGEQVGMASYLDSIIRDVEDMYGYSFPSRAKLVAKVKATSPSGGSGKGRPTSRRSSTIISPAPRCASWTSSRSAGANTRTSNVSTWSAAVPPRCSRTCWKRPVPCGCASRKTPSCRTCTAI